MSALSTIHPFPARMAPELARRAIENAPPNGQALDPMCGSGTVVRFAAEAGVRCVGIDIDPLSTLMAKAWTARLDVADFEARAGRLAESAKLLPDDEISPSADCETENYIDYWFAPRQRDALGRLATLIRREQSPMAEALAVAFSRIIISKEMTASLARDASHSRPHRVALSNGYEAYSGFLRSARHVARRLEPDKIRARADIRLGDARRLDGIEEASFDLAITSPPYLNAIDYMRGHRLTLVWLGYSMESLRKIRSDNVGAEKILRESESSFDISPFVKGSERSTIEPRHVGWTRRYASDMNAILGELKRVVKPGGEVVMVVGNSFLRGAVIDNAGIVESLAESVGFRRVGQAVRKIPARRRYLPPPNGGGENALDFRIREETTLTFVA